MTVFSFCSLQADVIEVSSVCDPSAAGPARELAPHAFVASAPSLAGEVTVPSPVAEESLPPPVDQTSVAAPEHALSAVELPPSSAAESMMLLSAGPYPVASLALPPTFPDEPSSSAPPPAPAHAALPVSPVGLELIFLCSFQLCTYSFVLTSLPGPRSFGASVFRSLRSWAHIFSFRDGPCY